MVRLTAVIPQVAEKLPNQQQLTTTPQTSHIYPPQAFASMTEQYATWVKAHQSEEFHKPTAPAKPHLSPRPINGTRHTDNIS